MFYEDRKCADIPLFLRKDHNQLKEILSLQRSDGGFDFVEPIDAYLYLSPSDIRRFAEDIEKNALRLKERLEFTRDTLKRLDYNIGGIVDNCSGILKFAYSELSGEGTTEKANAIKKDIGQFGEAVERHADGFSGKIKNHIKDLTFEIETGYRSLDPTRIVMTIIVLLLLEVKFNERKSEWKKNAQTSRNWLDDQFQRVMLKIDQQQLEYKIREFVHARVKD
jgi:hypothetical protein